MQADRTLNLLIALDDSDRANQLMYLLRDAGYVINSNIIDQNTDLDGLLRQLQCDLFLTETQLQSTEVRAITATLKNASQTRPWS